MRWAASVIACVGCGSSGVDIRVAALPGVEHVELFVAPAPCQPGVNAETCDRGVAWDGSREKHDGAIFILDIDHSTAGIAAADGSFRFTLHTGADAPHKVKRVAFVGYADAAGTTPVAAAWLTNVELPTDGAEEWRVTLVPVEPVPTTATPPAGEASRVHVWTRGRTATTRCVVGEYWHEGTVEREFLVPPGDTDCDDIDEANECDPYWWQTPGTRPQIEAASCATNLLGAPELPNPVCLVGGASCSEVGGTSEACVPVTPTHCVSSAACGATCRADFRGCVEALAIASVKCKVPTTELGTPCAGAATFTMDFQALVSQSINTCLPPRFAPVALPPMFESPATLETVTLSAESSTPTTCSPTVQWSGTHAPGVLYGLVAVPFGNNTASVLGMILEFEAGTCDTAQPFCTTFLSTDDDVYACGRADAVQ